MRKTNIGSVVTDIEIPAPSLQLATTEPTWPCVGVQCLTADENIECYNCTVQKHL